MQNRSIYIFPLQLVLVPGEIVPLNIFEMRYIDLMKECIGADKPFGISKLKQGSDTQTDVEFETIGCSAKIIDWDMPKMGFYQIQAVGESPFKIEETSRLPNGLLQANVVWLHDVENCAAERDINTCRNLLKEIYDQFESKNPEMIADLDKKNMGWISYKLMEVLSCDFDLKQQWLEERDSSKRIKKIIEYVRLN